MIGSFWWKRSAACVFSSWWFRHRWAWPAAGLDKFRAVVVRQRWAKTERLMRELKTMFQKWEQCAARSYVIVPNGSRSWLLLFKNLSRLAGNVCLLTKIGARERKWKPGTKYLTLSAHVCLQRYALLSIPLWPQLDPPACVPSSLPLLLSGQDPCWGLTEIGCMSEACFLKLTLFRPKAWTTGTFGGVRALWEGHPGDCWWPGAVLGTNRTQGFFFSGWWL